MRQSRPDSGFGFKVKALTIFEVFPSSLGGGPVMPHQKALRGPLIPESQGGRLSGLNLTFRAQTIFAVWLQERDGDGGVRIYLTQCIN